MFSQTKRNRFNFIYATLRKAQENGLLDIGQTRKELKDFLKKENEKSVLPSALTPKRFKEIVKKIREHGIQKFIDDFGDYGGNNKSKSKIQEDDLKLFLQAYFSGSQHSIKESWEYMLGGRDPQDFAAPSTFLYRTRKLYSQAQIDYFRQGKEKALRTWGASVPRVSVALPCETWIGDAMLFDFYITGKDGKQARAWLTAWMDEKASVLSDTKYTKTTRKSSIFYLRFTKEFWRIALPKI